MEEIQETVVEKEEKREINLTIIDFLMSKTSEFAYLDFKKIFSISKDSNFAKIAKDIFAFSNYGGGYIFFGMEQNNGEDPNIKSKFIPVGLPVDFNVDQASLQEKFNAYSNVPLEIQYEEFEKSIEGIDKKFALMYVPPGTEKVVPIKDGNYLEGGKKKLAFAKNQVFIRRGTQSVPAHEHEKKWIEDRAKDTHYKISILSGKADDFQETLTSNLFEFTKFPKYVWMARPLTTNFKELGEKIQSSKNLKNPKNTFFRFKIWDSCLVTLDDLGSGNSVYCDVIENATLKREETKEWLANPDKRRVIIELLKREIVSVAMDKGLYYDSKQTKKIYFASNQDLRYFAWSKNNKPGKMVAKKINAIQLKKAVFWHPSIHVDIEEVEGKFFLKIVPSFIITTDGKTPLIGSKEGTIITRLNYRAYNLAFVSTLAFWIEILGNKNNLAIYEDFEISKEPLSVMCDKGIKWDLPVNVLRDIENFIEEENNSQENGY